MNCIVYIELHLQSSLTHSRWIILDETSESNEEEKGSLITHQKEPCDSPLKQNLTNGNQANDESSLASKQEPVGLHCRENSDSQGNSIAESDETENVLSCESAMKSEKSSPNRGETVEEKENMSDYQIKMGSSSDVGDSVSQWSQHEFTPKAEKLQPRRNIVSRVGESQSDAESTPFKMQPEDDGYNWRKYGQKFVKDDKFIRGYYRCTYPSCQAKKQLERSNDGRMEVYCLGEHQHPKSRGTPVITTGLQVRPLAIARNSDADRKVPHGGGKYEQSNVARTGNDQTCLDLKANDVSSSKDESSPDSKRQKIEEALVNN